MAQTPANTIHAPNLARSAMAPEMRATVMMANVAWKAAKASVGYADVWSPRAAVYASPRPSWPRSMPRTPSMPTKRGLPAAPSGPLPNAMA